MKRLAFINLILSMVFMASFSTWAQPMPPQGRPEGPRKEKLSPEKIAQAKTEVIRKEIGLDEKQFKKIYKIYLKEERAKQQALEGNMFPPPGGFPGGMPSGGPGDGFPGGGFPGGGRPPQGGSSGMGPGMPPPGMFGEMAVPTVGGKAIDSDEYIDAREKKFKKILTPEQYQKFRTVHPDPTGFFMD